MRRLLAACPRSFIYAAVLNALALLLVSVRPAHAAMITDVADAAEPDKPIDINLGVGWKMDNHSLTIGREEQNSNGSIYNASEVAYSHVRNTLQAMLTIGLYHDLEFHIMAPYVVSDVQNWNYAKINGITVAPDSTIAHNTLDAGGLPLAMPEPLFTVPGQVNRSGFGDPSIGFAWGIFNEQRDHHLPKDWYPTGSRNANWTVGVDYTIPLAPVMDPSVTQPGNPNAASLPVGEGTHKIDFWTSMSKRFGPVEPFFRAHYTLELAASNAYNNCSVATPNGTGNLMIMSGEGQWACLNPVDTYWADKEGLQPSQVGGLMIGTEFRLFDNPTGPGLFVALTFVGDYISKGRNYSELSDELQKLTYTDQYFELNGKVTVDYRFVHFLHWMTYFSMGTDTTHFITDESIGVARGSSQYVELCPTDADPPPSNCQQNEVNPSYDFRYDVPGHRFLAMQVLNWSISTGLSFHF